MFTFCSSSKCSGLQNAAEYRRTQVVDGNSFTIMHFNANGIGNKLTDLGELLERHNIKVAVIQESMLSSKSKTPGIQNFTTLQKPESQETLVEPHLEVLTITATLGDTELIISNLCIPPPASFCAGGYIPSLDHLMMMTATLILGEFNAHHSA